MPRPRKVRPRGGVPGKHASPRTGSVYQLKSGPRRGEWRGAATATLADGSRKRVYAVGTDEAQTRAALDRRWAELEGRLAPTAATDADITVDGLLARWLTESVKLRLRGSTYDTYLSKAVHITKHLGRHPVRDLTRAQVRWFIGQLVDAGFAVSTIRTIMEVLNAALNYAVRDLEIIPKNPATGAGLPQPPVQDRVILTPEQIQRVLHYTNETGHPMATLLALVISTGVRLGESVGLRWQDVDLDVGVMRIRRQRTRGGRGEGVISRAPKTSAGSRPIPLMAFVVAQLRDYHSAQMAAMLRAPRPWADSDLVFRHNEDGRPFSPDYVDAAWSRLLARMGLQHMRFHDLRHTFATLLMGEVPNARMVSDLLGHANVKTTLGIYAQPLAAAQRAAIDSLERLIYPTSGTVGERVAVHATDESAEAY